MVQPYPTNTTRTSNSTIDKRMGSHSNENSIGALHYWQTRLAHQDYCKSCHDVEETESIQQHLLFECPVLQNRRYLFLVDRTFEDLAMVANVTLTELVGFIPSSGLCKSSTNSS